MRTITTRLSRAVPAAAVLIIAAFFPSCEHATGPVLPAGEGEPLPGMIIPWSSSSTVVCFGTSLTYGYRSYGILARPPSFATMGPEEPSFDYLNGYLTELSLLDADVDSSYPKYLARRLRIKVVNEGYVGATTARALELLDDSVLARNPALVLLEFGANDFLQGVNADTTESRMDRLIRRILAKGSVVVIISFINPDMINQVTPDYPLLRLKDRALAYYAMLKRVAERYSLERVDYPLGGIFGDPRYMSSDKLHPNGLGYRKMEENISRALFYTFFQSGMLK